MSKAKTTAEKASALVLWLLSALIVGFFLWRWNLEPGMEVLPWQGYFFTGISAFMLLYILFGISPT